MFKRHKRGVVTGLVALFVVLGLTHLYYHRDQSNTGVSITAVGSTALQPLVEAAGEEYTKENLGVFISVQGGGTGTGLSQVSQGAVDLGNSDVFAEEKDGIDASALVDHRVAVVGIAPLINKEAGVKSLTLEQLQGIFTGKITNWQEVGGKDMKIVILNRAAGSGTRATFEKYALDGADSIEAQEQDSSGTVRSIVATTPGAVSYAAFSYVDDSIVAPSIDGVSPTEDNVKTGRYPIWAYEHVYTKGQPKPEVAAFLDYLMSEDVQNELVPKLGYIPMSEMAIERDVAGKITQVNSDK
jgi:phosphate transport system substrate-binding protein